LTVILTSRPIQWGSLLNQTAVLLLKSGQSRREALRPPTKMDGRFAKCVW
jgi:hypothetical protein